MAQYASGGVLYHAATGQVLLQHRDDAAPAYPGQWGLFGGGEEPEDGGDPVATWCRELREELGIAVAPPAIVALGMATGRDGNARHLFACPWPELTGDFVLGEGQGYAWFVPEAALGLPLITPLAADCLVLFRAALGDTPT